MSTADCTLKEWLDRQPPAEMKRMERATDLSLSLLFRAKRGQKVRLEAAVLISRYTRGEVPVAVLTDASPEILAAAAETLARSPAA
jgi:hypothetical protein